MKVLFDFSLASDDIGGPRTVMKQLLSAWSETFPSDSLTVFGPASINNDTGARQVTPLFTWPKPRRVWQQQLELPFRRRLHSDADVIIVANMVRSLAPLHAPVVGILHDLRHLAQPEDFSAASLHFRRVVWTASARRMAGVVSVSQFSLDEALRLNFPLPEYTAVAHNGTDHVAIDDDPRVGGRYVLCVAHRSSKGLRDLADVWLATNESTNDLPELLVTGVQSERQRNEVRADFVARSIPRPPSFLPFLSSHDFAHVIQNASAVLYLSNYEGFGLVPSEASALGVTTYAYDLAPYKERRDELRIQTAPVGDPTSLGQVLGKDLSVATSTSGSPKVGATWRQMATKTRDLCIQVLRSGTYAEGPPGS